MKKLFMTLVVSLLLGGTIFAQHPETHWPGFDFHAFESQSALYASFMINGEPVTTATENWDQMEVAAFVGDELRMTQIYLVDYYLEWDLFPTTNADPIYYTTPGEEVSFKMYNHATGEEYEVCEPVIWDGDPITILTGEEHWEGFDDPDHPLMLNFIGGEPTPPTPTPTTFTKDIVGYGESDNYWYFIASPIEEPVTPSDENGFLTEAYDFFYFDQAYNEAEWRGYDMENFVVVNGKGYLYASQEATQLTFTGTPFTGDEGVAEVELTYETTGNPDWCGWNLVGNPFADSAYADRPFYRLDPETGLYVECTEDVVIPMMEGIFVETSEDVTDTEMMTFYAASYEGTSTGEGGGGDIGGKLVLNVNRGRGVSDCAIVRFDGKATLSKLHLNGPQVYFPVEGEDYAVVNAPEMGEMPVCFKAESNGSYMLSFSNKNVEFNYLHLIDNMTGADVDLLASQSYSFEATTSDYANRFKLVFATGSNSGDSFAFFSNGGFVISNEGEAMLQVVDVTGRILSNETINGSANVHVDAAPGVYMLRLINGDNVKVQKVVVK